AGRYRLARAQPAVLGAGQPGHEAVAETEPGVVEERVVQREGPPGLDRPDELDRLGRLEPGRRHRHEQGVDGGVRRYVEGVAGVVDAAVDEVPEVGHGRDVRMDQRVPPAVCPYPEPGRG